MNLVRTASTSSISRRIVLFAGVLAFSGASCGGCEGKSSGPGGGSSSGGGWLVGTSGLMMNVTMDDPPRTLGYKLDVPQDLRGIACRGDKEAWVVGGEGVLIATDDGGQSWHPHDSGTRSTLRAVSLATQSHVFIAGDSGVLRYSSNGGVDWTTVQSPPVAWTSIAARKSDGAAALLTTADGHVYHLDVVGRLLTQVGAIPAGSLHSVVLSRQSPTAVAVGDGGSLLVSDNGGIDWRVRASGTTQALRDVWLVGDGDRAVAVGDHGVMIEASLTSDAAPVVRMLGDDLTFRGIHMEASGHGTVVGDRGAVFVTHDFGATWDAVWTFETRDFLGVDALQVGAHL